jgi:hypothetical protein
MAIKYIPVSSINRAEQVSRKLWELTRPPSERIGESTTLYCGWLVHPVTGAVVLCLPDDDDQPIHIKADSTILDNILNEFVAAGKITLADKKAVKDAIADNKGGRANFLTFFPSYWKNLGKTEDQLRDEGWFNSVI